VTGSKLFVGGLAPAVTNEKLYELFASFGDIVNASVIPGKNFGFVEFASPAEAGLARENLDNTDFMGRIIHVDEARPARQAKSERPRTRRF